MFGTVVDKIQTLLSRSFLLGNFFPVLIFAVINFAIAWVSFDGLSDSLGTKWLTDATTFSTVLAFSLVIITIVAFILAPLIPLFRSILEGEFLMPERLRKRLIQKYILKSRQVEQRLQTAQEDYTFFDLAVRNAKTKFKDARDAPDVQDPANPVWLNDARHAFNAFVTDAMAEARIRADRDRLPDRKGVTTAIDKVSEALKRYPLQPGPTNPRPDTAVELNRIQGALSRRLQDARAFAYSLLQKAESEARMNYVPYDIRPTRVGNSRAALERYPSVAYNAEYEFLWPRLQMILLNDKTITPAVETATAQLNFAVLMTALSAVSSLIWIPVLGLVGNSLTLYITLGLTLPGFTLFLYQLVHETQKAFGSVIEMAIDGLRFELLKALRQPLPSSLKAEQETWKNLQIALYSGLDLIRYRHPKP
jgi:hypothetical protein